MGYDMTRRSASRGILYSTPPGTEDNESEIDVSAGETADAAAADD